MSTQNNLTDFLTDIADSIRAAKGTNSLINPQDFANNISDLSLGYNVTFNDGESDYTIVSVPPGGTISEPPAPAGTGTFKGWYTEASGGIQISFPYTPTGHVTLYAQFLQRTIIGATGFYNNQAGTLTWTDDIADFTSYTTSQVGNDVTVSSNLDNVFPYNQISEMTDAEGNVFIKIPKLWMKWVYSSNQTITGVKFSDDQVDEDYFIPDCFLDPSDPDLNTYLDYFAIAKYEGSGDTTKLYSKTGQSLLRNITRAQARTAARSYGTSDNAYNGYQLYDLSMWTVYNLLCSIYYKTTNLRSVYHGYTTVPSGGGGNPRNTGGVDGVSGLNGWNTSTECVKMLGVENPFGNCNKFIDGVFYQQGYTYLFVWRNPKNYYEGIYQSAAQLLTPQKYSYNRFPYWMITSAEATLKSYMWPRDVTSTEGYYGSKYYLSSSLSSMEKIVFTTGGYWQDAKCGIWTLEGVGEATTSSSVCARLAYRPVG